MNQQQLSQEEIELLSGFVDFFLPLNEEEEKLFQQEIDALKTEERDAVMAIITSWMDKGLKQGRQEGAVTVILRQLNYRFGNIVLNSEAKIRNLSTEKLEDLGEALLDFSEVADLVNWLDREVRN
jgi:hypothetical protein